MWYDYNVDCHSFCRLCWIHSLQRKSWNFSQGSSRWLVLLFHTDYLTFSEREDLTFFEHCITPIRSQLLVKRISNQLCKIALTGYPDYCTQLLNAKITKTQKFKHVQQLILSATNPRCRILLPTSVSIFGLWTLLQWQQPQPQPRRPFLLSQEFLPTILHLGIILGEWQL